MNEYNIETATDLLKKFEQVQKAGLTPENTAKMVDLLQREQEHNFAARQVRHADRVTGDDLRKHLRSDGSVAMTTVTEQRTFAGRAVEVEIPGLLDSAPSDEWSKDFRKAIQQRSLARMFLVGERRGTVAARTPKLDSKILSLAARAPDSIRAGVEKAFSDTSGAGAEWIPDNWATQLYEDFYLPSSVEAIFQRIQLDGTWIMPRISDVTRPYLGGSQTTDIPTAIPASTPTTANATVAAIMLAVRMLLDVGATEDSIIPVIPEMQRRLARALADGFEDGLINGDSTATHQDAIALWNIRSRWGLAGLGGSADHRRGFKGLRRLAVDKTNTVDQSAGQTIAKILEELVGRLGERGNVGTKIITSPEVFFKKIMTDSNLLTVDKVGALASLLTGNVARVSGMDIILSRFVSADLATTGLFTNTGSYSGVLAVCPEDFAVFERRGSMVEMEKEIGSQTYELVGTRRVTFASTASDSAKNVAFGYKWL